MCRVHRLSLSIIMWIIVIFFSRILVVVAVSRACKRSIECLSFRDEAATTVDNVDGDGDSVEWRQIDFIYDYIVHISELFSSFLLADTHTCHVVWLNFYTINRFDCGLLFVWGLLTLTCLSLCVCVIARATMNVAVFAEVFGGCIMVFLIAMATI